MTVGCSHLLPQALMHSVMVFKFVFCSESAPSQEDSDSDGNAKLEWAASGGLGNGEGRHEPCLHSPLPTLLRSSELER